MLDDLMKVLSLLWTGWTVFTSSAGKSWRLFWPLNTHLPSRSLESRGRPLGMTLAQSCHLVLSCGLAWPLFQWGLLGHYTIVTWFSCAAAVWLCLSLAYPMTSSKVVLQLTAGLRLASQRVARLPCRMLTMVISFAGTSRRLMSSCWRFLQSSSGSGFSFAWSATERLVATCWGSVSLPPAVACSENLIAFGSYARPLSSSFTKAVAALTCSRLSMDTSFLLCWFSARTCHSARLFQFCWR